MSQPLPLALHILRLTAHGEGVGRAPDGRLVFVEGALPGEDVRAEVTEEQPRFLRARLCEVPAGSALRRALDCPYDSKPPHQGCGGCGLRHVRDDQALSLKADATHAELSKLAPAVAWPSFVLHPSPLLDGYRHRLSLHADKKGGIGFYRAGSHEVIKTPDCLAACDAIKAAWPALCALASGLATPPQKWVVESHQGKVWSAWKGPSTKAQRAAADGLVASGVLAGVSFLDLQHRVVHTAGNPWMEISHTVGGRALTYNRLIGAFGQANPFVNERLLGVVAAQVGAWGCGQVADLYCGSGNLTLAAALAPSVERVWAVEVAADGVLGVRRSASASGLGFKVEVVQRDLSTPLDPKTQEKLSDAVLLDPPRTGAKELIKRLRALGPRRVLYVSCSPPHLARDLALLGPAYRLEALHAFDMFPRTPHLEVVACLARV